MILEYKIAYLEKIQKSSKYIIKNLSPKLAIHKNVARREKTILI